MSTRAGDGCCTICGTPMLAKNVNVVFLFSLIRRQPSVQTSERDLTCSCRRRTAPHDGAQHVGKEHESNDAVIVDRVTEEEPQQVNDRDPEDLAVRKAFVMSVRDDKALTQWTGDHETRTNLKWIRGHWKDVQGVHDRDEHGEDEKEQPARLYRHRRRVPGIAYTAYLSLFGADGELISPCRQALGVHFTRGPRTLTRGYERWVVVEANATNVYIVEDDLLHLCCLGKKKTSTWNARSNISFSCGRATLPGRREFLVFAVDGIVVVPHNVPHLHYANGSSVTGRCEYRCFVRSRVVGLSPPLAAAQHPLPPTHVVVDVFGPVV